MDGNNDLYVLDNGNNRVQHCTFGSAWTCSTLADLLNNPQGITVDSSNNVFIADLGNGRIIKCPAGSSCSVLAGGIPGFADLAVDSSGRIYAADAHQSYIARYSSSGTPLGVYLGFIQVPYLTDTNHFNQPRVAVDANDNLIVIEQNGVRLSKYDSQGVWKWSIGTPGFSASDNSHFQFPRGAATDASGNIYVADGNRVQIFSPAGTYLDTIGWKMGGSNFQFGWVTGVAVDQANGKIYVADGGYNYQHVEVFDSNRQHLDTLGETGVSGSDNGHFNNPMGLEVDKYGNLYVADSGNCRVQKFNSSLVYQMTFGLTGSCSNRFSDVGGPEDVTVDAQGRVYIADNWNNRVEVFDSTGAYLTTIGGSWGTLSSQFRGPNGVAVDSKGNVYISDYTNARIQKFAPGVPGWRQANINGFGEVNNILQLALETFNNQLYASATNWNWNYGARIYRSPDGVSWSPVSDYGFGNGLIVGAVIDLQVFNNQLYASTGYQAGQPGHLFRSTDGTTWAPVLTTDYENDHDNGVGNLAVYQNKLYALVTSENQGLSLWRSDSGNPDTWVRIFNGGNGNSNNNWISGYAVLNDYLYAAVENNIDGAQIWRSSDGLTWDRVSDFGFGNVANTQTGGMAVFNGALYVGTKNTITGAEIWTSSNGTSWSRVGASDLTDPNNFKVECVYTFGNTLLAVTDNTVTGSEVWKSTDGAHWMLAAPPGFGNSNTVATLNSNGATIFKGNFYLGLDNQASGGEIWQIMNMVYVPVIHR